MQHEEIHGNNISKGDDLMDYIDTNKEFDVDSFAETNSFDNDYD
jgi:hypothetical protein